MWEPPALGSLPSWNGERYVSIDTETCNPNIKTLGSAAFRDGYIVGYSFAFRDGFKAYIPVRHADGGNVDYAQAMAYLRDQAHHFRGQIIGANLKYDLGFLLGEGITFPHAQYFRDIQIADPLIDELQQYYSLEAIAQRWGFEGKQETLLQEAAKEFGLDSKADIYQFHSKYVGPYAERDASLPLEIYLKQCEEIDKQELWEIFDLESRLLPTLVAMEARGVRVDLERLAQVEGELFDAEVFELTKIHHETGVHIASEDIWKKKAVLPLFDSLGIDLPLTMTGQRSVAESVISKIQNESVQSLIHARKLNKLRTTFCESIKRFEVNGRIHCQYNQVRNEFGGAAYGRMSCSKPNLQQIPRRTKEGNLIRSIFIPDEGMKWASLDFSSQEPRILFHYANRLNLQGVAEVVDILNDNSSYDVYQPICERMGVSRDVAKTIMLGLSYGAGPGLLARQLNLPHNTYSDGAKTRYIAGPEAEALLIQFHKAAPYISKLSKKCEESAERKGFIRTLLGRKCRFPKVWGEYDLTYKALNRLCQGSAADQTKLAMVLAHEEGLPIQVAIHDELTISSLDSPGCDAERLQQIMINAVQLDVPTVCDIKYGDSWGGVKK